MGIRYTKVTRSTMGPDGRTEVDFMSSHGSDVYVSEPRGRKAATWLPRLPRRRYCQPARVAWG